MTRVSIPPYKLRLDSALLECHYELKNSKSDTNSRGNPHIYEHHFSGTSHNDNDENIDEEEALYSVKWYKDNEEFYRYVPKAKPPQHSYRVDGIKVDVSINHIFNAIFIQIFIQIEYVHIFYFFFYRKGVSSVKCVQFTFKSRARYS